MEENLNDLPPSGTKWLSRKCIMAILSLIAITLSKIFDASYGVNLLPLAPLVIMFVFWLDDLIKVIRSKTVLSIEESKERFASRKLVTSIMTLACGLFTLISGKEVSDMIMNLIPMVYPLLQAILDGLSRKKLESN